MAAHEITMRGTTPDGVKVQVEDWSKVYEGATWGTYVLGAYAPVTNLAALEHDYLKNAYSNGTKMRLEFEFFTMAECVEAFEAVTSGAGVVQDYADHLNAMHYVNGYLTACGMEPVTA